MTLLTWQHTTTAQRVVFAAGAAGRVGEHVKELGSRRTLLLATRRALESETGEAVVRSLGRSLAATFSEITPHLPTITVQAAVAIARAEGIDAVVGLGGGSSIDLAKAVNYFTEVEQGVRARSFTDRPVLPVVAIPTTYSGSEATSGFGMTDERTRTKTGGGSVTCTPAAVVYDPRATLDTPTDLTAQTALNALAHCVEAAYSMRRSPEAEALAVEGARMIAGSLPSVVDQPDDLEARTTLLTGAALAARSLVNAATGVHHALARLVGGRTGMGHGLANALILPAAMRANAEVVPEQLARIGAALGDEADPVGAVERLIERIGISGGLSDHGMTDDDLAAVVHAALGGPWLADNPRPLDESDLTRILEDAW
jgi:maleylacetate reductase